ncbi:MAG: hypothetical protein ACTHPS_30850 [Streptosporangiaceae bacterium]
MASRGRQLTQGEVLSRAVQAQRDRRERRVLGAARVNRLLAGASLANDVKRYREDRYETLRLIERLGSPGRGAAVSRSQRSTEHTGPDCQVCAEGRRLDAARAAARRGRDADYGEIYRVQPYCRGCGALTDWCRCGGMTVRAQV